MTPEKQRFIKIIYLYQYVPHSSDKCISNELKDIPEMCKSRYIRNLIALNPPPLDTILHLC